MGKKTIDEYCELIETYKELPNDLAFLLIDMGIKYAKMSEIYKDLRIAKNEYWQNYKVKGKSDKSLEIQWFCTKEGTKEMRATIEIKILEKLMSNCKTYLRHLENISHNNY